MCEEIGTRDLTKLRTIVKRPLLSLAINLCFLLVAGCSGAVKRSGSEVSPDNKLALNVVVVESSRQLFNTDAHTTVNVSITDRNLKAPVYFAKQQYSFDSANLDWQASWETPSRATVRLFTVTSHENKKERSTLRVPIAVIALDRESGSKEFEIKLNR
jgi:hypothetical protein